ncbi:MAG: NgoMIV family type II restriction endonuclease [Actinomycetota bacterium]|nr:NgoMIV family type II restriction endonuclease [Actinomycetota bacterium]
MSTPAFLSDILGWRGGVPNTADKGSRTSIEIASGILQILEIDESTDLTGQGAGALLERGVAEMLAANLNVLAPNRVWSVALGQPITEFAQYAHVADLDNLISEDRSGILRTVVGSDYLIKPDVTVALENFGELPFLHAAVSCKWTIRSDRVQNIRHESVLLTRLRRGRQPHIVSVTAEPLPTRLAAIARGTGEVDAVYHAAFEPLVRATDLAGTVEQQDALAEMIDQRRLFDLSDLPVVLATY